MTLNVLSWLKRVVATAERPHRVEVEKTDGGRITIQPIGHVSVDEAQEICARIAAALVGAKPEGVLAALERAAKEADDSAAEAQRLRDELDVTDPEAALLRTSRNSWFNTARAIAAAIRAIPVVDAVGSPAGDAIKIVTREAAEHERAAIFRWLSDQDAMSRLFGYRSYGNAPSIILNALRRGEHVGP